jgi:hypothetical protein
MQPLSSTFISNVIAVALCLAFLAIAAWHLYMAFVPPKGPGGAVPSVEGKPLFVPSRGATLGIAFMLACFAALVAATAGLISVPVRPVVLVWLSFALALGLAARALGEFRYVGFFKRVRKSRFASLDTWFYSPLCLLLAVGVAFVALSNGH